MRKLSIILAVALVAMIATLATVRAGEEKKAEAAAVTITGKVDAAAKDGDKVTAVKIVVDEKTTVLVCPKTGKCKDLLAMVGKTVKATGTVTKDDKGVQTMSVTACEEVKAEKAE